LALNVVRMSFYEHVATITLNRPSSGNAVDESLAFALKDAVTEVSQNDDVRVVVLTGEGPKFCVGTETPKGSGHAILPEALERWRVAGSVASLGKPVIAAINGDAMDQGLELALACDIRVASEGSHFGLTQVRAGLTPWDGGTQRLPRLVGRGIALEMIMTSRTVDAEEALAIGLVNRLVKAKDVSESAMDVARTIASHGPIAAGYLKEAVLKGMDMTLEQGLRLEADLNLLLQTTTDRAEGIQSFLQRRGPDYSGK
jgi:enoyl-CoA hydratase/carnithine racemase